MSADTELGMISGLLGYALVSMAKADVTLLVRNESFLSGIDYLKAAGWSKLETIYNDDFDDGSNRHVLVYKLLSECCIHKSIAVQVVINSKFPWHSLVQVFPSASEKEAYLHDHYGITFSESPEIVKSRQTATVAWFGPDHGKSHNS